MVDMAKKIVFLLLTMWLLSACTGGSLATPAPVSPSPAPPEKGAPPSPAARNPCGDGVCDTAEQANPALCPGDCPSAATAAPAPAATAVPQPSPTPQEAALPAELTFFPDPGIRILMAAQPAPVVMPDGSVCILYRQYEEGEEGPGFKAVACADDGLTFTETGLDPTTVTMVSPFATRMSSGVWRLFDVVTGPQGTTLASRTSEDGIAFTQDAGVRYTFPEEHLPIGVRDFYTTPSGDVVFLYIGAMGKAEHHIRLAASTDGGETFTLYRDDALGDAAKDDMERYLDPKFVVLPDGSARLFTMVQHQVPIPMQRACCDIYSLTTTDGYTYTPDPGVRLAASDFTEFTVWSLNDPWVVLLPDGRFRMYVAALVDDGSSDRPFWAVVSATTP